MTLTSSNDQPRQCDLSWPNSELREALERVDLFTLWLGRSIEACVRGDQSLEQWQSETFEVAARQRFLELGSALDRVCLSVLQSDDTHLAQEWYFKLQDGDADFGKLAPQSLGSSRDSGGHVGPLRIEELQAPLDRMVLRAQPGVIQPPLRIPNGRSIVLRLDSRLPAQWDDATSRELTLRLHRDWLTNTINTLLASDPRPESVCSLPLP
ncbi:MULTISPECIES: peptidylprolyl isomerase [unclassified Synechococcus]|uniref:peptidylprolyl isomerase n=1 Tax=unclassified Synechococcus TaxID=2626047 RepID=UPI0039AEC87B